MSPKVTSQFVKMVVDTKLVKFYTCCKCGHEWTANKKVKVQFLITVHHARTLDGTGNTQNPSLNYFDRFKCSILYKRGQISNSLNILCEFDHIA
jgi:hypothetical protein